jgi:hypothetical protein
MSASAVSERAMEGFCVYGVAGSPGVCEAVRLAELLSTTFAALAPPEAHLFTPEEWKSRMPALAQRYK